MMSEEMFKRKLKKLRKRGERYKKEKEIADEYVQYLPDHKKRKVSNVMLTIIVVAILVYTIASFWIQYQTGMAIDSTLSTLYYGFWTVELISLTTIKNQKTKYGINDNNSCD